MANCFSHIAGIIEDALRSSGLAGNFTVRCDKARRQLATNAALTARACGAANAHCGEPVPCEPGMASDDSDDPAPCGPGIAGIHGCGPVPCEPGMASNASGAPVPCEPGMASDACNTPMETAKRLAGLIAASPLVSQANIAPPGFINIQLSNMGLLACLENLRNECAVLIKSYRREGLAIWSGGELPPCYYPSVNGEKYIIVQAVRKSRSLIRIAHQEKLARFSVKDLWALDAREQCAGSGEQFTESWKEASESNKQLAGNGKGASESGDRACASATPSHRAHAFEAGKPASQNLGLSPEEISILLETADLLPCLSQKKSFGRAVGLGQYFCHYYNNCSILKGSAKLISLRLLISEAAGAALALSMPIEKQEAKACKGK